jgi:hypothetical protein
MLYGIYGITRRSKKFGLILGYKRRENAARKK